MLSEELHDLLEQECERWGVNEVARRLDLDSGQVSRLRRRERGFGPGSLDRLGHYLDLTLVKRNEIGGAAKLEERLGEQAQRRAVTLLEELLELRVRDQEILRELRRLLGG